MRWSLSGFEPTSVSRVAPGPWTFWSTLYQLSYSTWQLFCRRPRLGCCTVDGRLTWWSAWLPTVGSNPWWAGHIILFLDQWWFPAIVCNLSIKLTAALCRGSSTWSLLLLVGGLGSYRIRGKFFSKNSFIVKCELLRVYFFQISDCTV